MADFRRFLKLARPMQYHRHGRERFPGQDRKGNFEMQNVNSIVSRMAAFAGASTITALMLFAYFTPASSTAIGLIA